MLPELGKAGKSQNEADVLPRSLVDYGVRDRSGVHTNSVDAHLARRVIDTLGRGLSAVRVSASAELSNWRQSMFTRPVAEEKSPKSNPAQNFDLLTGLPARELFAERLSDVMVKSRLVGTSISVLVVCVDGLKAINDRLGTAAGDRLLCATARRIEERVPVGATIARLGGDQFAIILDTGSEARDRQVAERLGLVFQIPFLLEGQRVTSTVSIGLARCRGEERPSDVIRWADIAMRDAKVRTQARKQSKVCVFDVETLRRVEERLQMEAAFDYALRHDTGQFDLVYQPIFDVVTGRPRGIEALMRWRHPMQGAIDPTTFIALAEETGLIHDMSEWALRNACRSFASLRDNLPAAARLEYVSVNFSAAVLQSERIVTLIVNCLRANGLPTSCLAVEVTESVIASGSPSIVKVLNRLRAAGVRILLDDFGVGFSSLASLMDLPVDAIKIDRAFVGFLDERPAARAIVQAIVDLANALQIEIICEGIERKEQLDIVASMGRLLCQGFLFSLPLTLAKVEDYLNDLHTPGKTQADIS